MTSKQLIPRSQLRVVRWRANEARRKQSRNLRHEHIKELLTKYPIHVVRQAYSHRLTDSEWQRYVTDE